ncbi:MAG: PAS domain-containing protein, partial [Pirellulales bacterium]
MSADPSSLQSAEAEIESLRRRVAQLEEQLQNEREIKARREQFLSMLAYVPDTVFMIDRQGTLLYLNRVREPWTLADVLGASAYDFVAPEHHTQFREALARVFATGEPQRHEIRALRPDGGWSWYSCLVGPVWQDGQVVAAAGTAADIDQLKRTQEALQSAAAELESRVAERTHDLAQANQLLRREAAQRLQAERERQEQARLLALVLDSMAVGVVIADRRGDLTRVNPAAAKIVGVETGDVSAFEERWAQALFLPDGCTPYPAEEQPLRKALRGESVEGEEVLFLHPDHWEGMWLQVTARPLEDSQGTRYGALLVFRNVTLQKRALTA